MKQLDIYHAHAARERPSHPGLLKPSDCWHSRLLAEHAQARATRAARAASRSLRPTPAPGQHSIVMGGGAQLAEPRTALQTQFLAHELRAAGAESLWIGLRKEGDGTTAANFRWAGSGEPLRPAEARWSATEPNGEAGDCVEMWEDGTWNDRACDIGKVLACEVPVR